jgi:dTDP-4-dehydrorhamnose 3,5-epimerase-like enzyme
MFVSPRSDTRGVPAMLKHPEEPMPSTPRPPGARSGAVAAEAPATLLGGAVRLVELESFRDDRGTLTPITLDELAFSVARAFVVRAPRGAIRGGHAHRRVRQVLFRASGTIDVEVSHRGERARVILDQERPAVLLEAGVWAQQTYLDDDATLIVFADGPYEAAEYSDDDADVERS